MIKQLILFAFAAIWVPTVQGQNERKFIEDVLKLTDSVIYLDKLSERDVVKMKTSFIMNTSDFVKGTGDKLKLSDTEIAHVNKAFTNMYDHKWEEGLLTNSKVMPRDTFLNLLSAKPDGWDLLHNKGIKAVYSISKPIFIRDTLCLFYWGVHCGNRCGEGEFALYEKQKGRWVKLRWLYNWII